MTNITSRKANKITENASITILSVLTYFIYKSHYLATALAFSLHLQNDFILRTALFEWCEALKIVRLSHEFHHTFIFLITRFQSHLF